MLPVKVPHNSLADRFYIGRSLSDVTIFQLTKELCNLVKCQLQRPLSIDSLGVLCVLSSLVLISHLGASIRALRESSYAQQIVYRQPATSTGVADGSMWISHGRDDDTQ